VADLLFELRCEELPPRDLPAAAQSLQDALTAALADAQLPVASTCAAWTPRRMAVWAVGVPERTADREERLAGPKLRVAFDESGRPTKAAEGFAKKAGVRVEELEKDGESVFATKRTAGRAALGLVAEILPELPSRVKWKKTMRWGIPDVFARPIRGVVALLGGDVVPCEVAGVAAGRTTRGHPFLAPREVVLDTASPAEYVSKLRDTFVLADPVERRDAVLASARKLVPGLEVRDELLLEVTNLVEWPTALLGTFAERFRDLPPKLLVTVMEHHQRFFPVRGAGDALEPRFVAILDRDRDSVETARHGFERVLVPRLHDAAFFFSEDTKTRLVDRLPKLNDVTYHRKLGTLGEKATRLAELADRVAAAVGGSRRDAERARMAGVLAKCDLVTLLVGEFPELQGYVGSVYAARDGEPPEVCEAIARQYQHDFAGVAALPAPALVLVLAENLDVLCQFGTRVGLPTGSTDPFGVRRAALTLLDVCDRFAPDLDVPAAIRTAGGNDAVLDYVDTRLRQRLRDEGFRHDHVEAVRAWTTVGAFRSRLADLKALAADASFGRLLEVAERCRNITKKAEPAEATGADVESALLAEPAERALAEVWFGVRKSLPAAPAALSRDDAARVAHALAEPLHRFFAEVFVNAEDAAVRRNRLALLRQIDGELQRFADLCRIQKA
jgi:glycyl-tRNA synthetase beta chain